MGRLWSVVVVVVLGVGAAGWWYAGPARALPIRLPSVTTNPDAWVDKLFSKNPSEAAEAKAQLEARGVEAVPAIRTILQDPRAQSEKQKSALKGCAILGLVCEPAIADVASMLTEPDLTAEAAVALSFMGPDAFPLLKVALDSESPDVRREALRSIGKLQERAPLDAAVVLPLLLEGAADPHPAVRAVASTYLGIIHTGGARTIETLTRGLTDSDTDVRRASAGALGSYGAEAASALAALQKAASDPDPDVAREAGLAIVKLHER